jgi:glutamate-1-semialdehyde aminotransferase
VAAEMTGHAPMAQLRFLERDPERLDRLWTSFIAACAVGGVLTGRGRLWFITHAHTEQDIDRAVEVCAEAFQALHQQDDPVPRS